MIQSPRCDERPHRRRHTRARVDLEALEARQVLSTGLAPALEAGLHAVSDPDGNGVVVRDLVAIQVEADPGTVVRLDQGADGRFDQARLVGPGGKAVFLTRIRPGLNDYVVEARDRSGATSTAELSALRGDAVLNWNATFLDLVRKNRLNPLTTSRGLAMLHTAIYDAVNSVEGSYEPYIADAGAPRWVSAEAAASAAGYRVLSELFPNDADLLAASYQEGLGSAVGGAQARRLGVSLGEAVGNTVLAVRANDGWNATADYTPTDAPGRWRPIPVRPGGPSPAGLSPRWGSVTPWAMIRGDQFLCPPPPALDSAEYAAAVAEVAAYGAADSAIRTEDQTNIALFWSDDAGTFTPPGHWNAIAAEVASRFGQSLAENARTFALLSFATADAAITCWETKYTYDLWRPYSAIREADTDGNPQTVADPDWEALIFIPPFPTYSSGHSTFSGAASAVLAAVFGCDDISFTTGSDGVGVADRSFTSFSQAALEAADSRLYGGIHFSFDNQAGIEAGTALGNYIAANFLRPRTTPLS